MLNGTGTAQFSSKRRETRGEGTEESKEERERESGIESING